MRSILLTGLAFLLALAWSAPGRAGEIDDAKRAGLVGERFDGYLGAVEAQPSEATQRLVTTINTQRREKYREIAANNGIALDQVERLSGQKLIQRAAAGHFVMLPDGGWTRK
jgi:uncharacterized protein YdbL (DUF1318 family)